MVLLVFLMCNIKKIKYLIDLIKYFTNILNHEKV